MVSVLLIVRSKEEGGGDYRSDIDQVGVVWLAVFDLKVFPCRFEEGGKFFRRRGVGAGLLAFLLVACWRLLVAYWRRSITNQLY